MIYIEVETKPEIKKPVTNVHFASDYDITDVLTRWGNWARKGAYEQSGSMHLYESQKREWKECCSDDDGLIISGVISAMRKIKTQKTQEELNVLLKHYYGDEVLDDDYIFVERYKVKESVLIIIKPRSLKEIADEFGCGETNIRKIKSSAESFIVGALSMLTMQTGTELELLQNIRVLK